MLFSIDGDGAVDSIPTRQLTELGLQNGTISKSG